MNWHCPYGCKTASGNVEKVENKYDASGIYFDIVCSKCKRIDTISVKKTDMAGLLLSYDQLGKTKLVLHMYRMLSRVEA